ncbi:hypothetical protein C8Q80DRAFT_1169550 [Daedaleopsis nitida]|nr:hypothetical protein C8Q80DRAFT_1169550 [Daedaleopsis nitida]
MFFFLPFVFGCPTRMRPEGDQTPRICPKCHNISTIRVKSRMWFELCFVPLIPMKKEHLWVCTVCQWNIPLQQGWEPALPGYGFHHGGQGPMPPSPYTQMSPPPNAAAHGYQPQYPAPPPNVKHN